MAHADEVNVQERRVVSPERRSQDFITIFADLLARRLYERPPPPVPSLRFSGNVLVRSWLREKGITKPKGKENLLTRSPVPLSSAGRMRGEKLLLVLQHNHSH